jgi:hypothetical protein
MTYATSTGSMKYAFQIPTAARRSGATTTEIAAATMSSSRGQK